MNYEATDRYMSSWVVSCVKNGTRFYLTPKGLATDTLSEAAVSRWADVAQNEADLARAERAWAGFDWQPVRTAEAKAEVQ